MESYTSQALNLQDVRIADASDPLGYADINAPGTSTTVTVRHSSDLTLATLFSDNGVTSLSNPFNTTAEGAFTFFAANGLYNVTINESLASEVSINDIKLFDQLDLPTTTELIAGNRLVKSGDIIETSGFTTKGDGGGAKWQFNGVTGQTASQTPAQLVSAKLNDAAGNQFNLVIDGAINVKHLGALGDGSTDDRLPTQVALNVAGDVAFPKGNYLISDSGNTVAYRAVTAKVGLSIKSNTAITMEVGAIIKPVSGSKAIPFVADGVADVKIVRAEIDGNPAIAADGLSFGIYYHNCTDASIDYAKVYDTYSNTVEIIGCTNVSIGTIDSQTTSANSIGGGPQFEDNNNVTAVNLTGSTFDDLVSVIAHGADVNQHNFLAITGKSDSSRVFFIGQSASATGQRTLRNITALVNSKDSGLNNISPAFSLFREGFFQNIYVTQVDHGSYKACRINPFDGAANGRLYNSTFDITSYNSQVGAIDVNHNGDSNTIMEHNTLIAKIVNPNDSDSASDNVAVKVRSGSFWNIDVNIDYRVGKTNIGSSLILGDTDVDSTVINSTIEGSISGGDVNMTIVRGRNNTVGSLVLQDTENAADTALYLQSTALETNLGSIEYEGELLDESPSVTRTIKSLFKEAGEANTGGATIETDLMSYTLPGNFMGKTGVLRIKASGRFFSNNGNKTLTFYFGSTAHVLHAAANSTDNWTVEINILQLGNRSSQRLDIAGFQASGIMVIAGATDGEDTTVDKAIKFTGLTANGADEVEQRTMTVEAL